MVNAFRGCMKICTKVSAYGFIVAMLCMFSKANAESFIENKKQWNNEVLAKMSNGSMTTWLGFNKVRFNIKQSIANLNNQRNEIPALKNVGHVWDMEFSNSLNVGSYSYNFPNEQYYNYLQGNNEASWSSYCYDYQSVRVNNLYPGVHVKHYVSSKGFYEFDLELDANADLSLVELKFTGLDNVMVKDDELILKTSIGNVYTYMPKSYYLAGDTCEVVAKFIQLPNGNIGFKLADVLPENKRLIIDPILEYSSYITCALCDDYSYAVQADSTGSAYFAGVVFGENYPTTIGAYDTSYNEDGDTYITKMKPDGSGIVFSTFIGGDTLDIMNSIRINEQGEVFGCGYTVSNNFPTTANNISNTYLGGWDSFVLRLNSTGSALIYSTLVTGSNSERAYAMELFNNEAYLVGSSNSPNFPISANAIDDSVVGGQDVFLTIINTTGDSVIYSSFFGGSGNDIAYGVDIDNEGNAYLVGFTKSNNLPTTLTAFDKTYGGDRDGLAMKWNRATNQLDYLTYIGHKENETFYSCRVNTAGELYFAGSSNSSKFPVKPFAFDTSFNIVPYSEMVIGKLNAKGSDLNYSTFLGGGRIDVAYGIALSSSDDVIIAGETTSADFPMDSTSVQFTHGGGYDFILAILNDSLTKLKYSSYLGGPYNDYNRWAEPALLGDSIMYVTGTAHSFDFPTTANAYQPVKIDSHLNDAPVLMKWNIANFIVPDSAIALPTDLILFSANATSEKVMLNWQTAAEIDLDKFEIQHSSNGIDWLTIGSVNGKGNSIIGYSYQFLDENPLITINYYRLKIIDLNEQFDYSEMRSVSFNEKDRVAITFNNDVLQLAFNYDTENMQLQIFDYAGKRVLNRSIGSISSGELMNYRLNGLVAGVYYVSINSLEYSNTINILKAY